MLLGDDRSNEIPAMEVAKFTLRGIFGDLCYTASIRLTQDGQSAKFSYFDKGEKSATLKA